MHCLPLWYVFSFALAASSRCLTLSNDANIFKSCYVCNVSDSSPTPAPRMVLRYQHTSYTTFWSLGFFATYTSQLSWLRAHPNPTRPHQHRPSVAGATPPLDGPLHLAYLTRRRAYWEESHLDFGTLWRACHCPTKLFTANLVSEYNQSNSSSPPTCSHPLLLSKTWTFLLRHLVSCRTELPNATPTSRPLRIDHFKLASIALDSHG